MRRPADAVQGLARLCRVAEAGGREIGLFLVEHDEEVAAVLGTTRQRIVELYDKPDEELAPILAGMQRDRRARLYEARACANKERSCAAAEAIARSVRWHGRAALVDPALLLCELPADPQPHHVLFRFQGADEVAVWRQDLARTGKILGGRADLVAFIDPEGVHVRWHEGRGGLNWRARDLTAPERAQALVVPLPRVPQPLRKHPVRPRWTWDELGDLLWPSAL